MPGSVISSTSTVAVISQTVSTALMDSTATSDGRVIACSAACAVCTAPRTATHPPATNVLNARAHLCMQ